MRQLVINIVIGCVLSGVCIVIILSGVDFSKLGDTLAAIDISLCILYFLALFAIHMIRLVRWGFILRPLGDISWRRVLSICAIGQLAIYLFPARLGELARPLLISEESSISFGQASATVAVERIVDGIIICVLLFVTVLLLGPSVPTWFVYSGLTASAVFAGLAVGIVAAGIWKDTAKRFISWTVGRLSQTLSERLAAVVDQFFLALMILSRRRQAALSYILASVSMWILMAVSFIILFAAFGFSELGIVAGLALNSLLIVSIMIPAAPGFTGTFHSATVLALGLFAIEKEAAVDFAFLLHLETVVLNLLLGTGGLLLGHIPFTRLLRIHRRAAKPPAPAAVSEND